MASKSLKHHGLILLILAMLPRRSFSFMGHGNFHCLHRIISRPQSSFIRRNLVNLPWFGRDGSKGKDEQDVWGDDSDKNNGKGGKPTKSAPTNSSSKSGLGGVAGIMDSMENFKTAQQVGKMTNSLVQDLQKDMFEGVAVDGKVKVVFDGQQRPIEVQIDDAYLKGVEAADLSSALTAAMKDAYHKSSEKMDEKMKSFYVDLGLK